MSGKVPYSVTVSANTAEAKQKLKDLGEQLDEFSRKKREALKAGDLELSKSLGKEISVIRKEMAQWKKQTLDVEQVLQNINKVPLNQLRASLRSLRKDFGELEQGSDKYYDTLAKIRRLEGQIGKASGGGRFSGLSKFIPIAGASVVALRLLRSAVVNGTKEFALYDDKLADVMKTTGLTKTQTEALSRQLRKIDTRTSQMELLDLARVAGKLGLTGSEDVEGFVRAADKINVALSEDLGGNAEEALNQIGKLVDIFRLKETYGIEDAMIRVGSVINELGASSTANEGYLVDFTKRLAGVAPQAGISIENIIGLGATLDQFGQQCETAGTAVSQAISGMFKKTDVYARIAGMSVKDFAALMNNDANAAFITFLRGLNNGNGGMAELTKNLGSLKLEGSRAVQILGALAKNVDVLEQQQQLANKAFADGTSILNEFNTKNSSAQAQFEKSKKILQNWKVEIGRGLMPVVYGLTDALARLATSSQQQLMDEVTQYKTNRAEIDRKKKTVHDLLTTYYKLNAATVRSNKDQETFNKTIRDIGEIYPEAITKTNSYGEAVEINTQRLKRAIEAEEKLNKLQREKTMSKVAESLKEQISEIDIYTRKKEEQAIRMSLAQKDIMNAGEYTAGAEQKYEIAHNLFDKYDKKIKELNLDARQNVDVLYEQEGAYGKIADIIDVDIKRVIELGKAQKQLTKDEINEALGEKKKNNTDDFTGDDKKKSQKSWTLDQDKGFMQGKLALQQKRIAGELSSEDDYNRQLQALEIESLEARIASGKESGDRLLKLQNDLAEKKYRQTKSEQDRIDKLIAASLEGRSVSDGKGLMDAEKNAYDKRLKDLGLFGKSREQMTAQEQAASLNLEQQHLKKLQQIYVDAETKKIQDQAVAAERSLNQTKQAHNQELAAADTFEAKKALVDKYQLGSVRTSREADRLLRQYYASEEEKEAREHYEKLIEEYTKFLEESKNIQANGFSLGSLNEEETERVQQLIDELNKKLAELKGTNPVNDDKGAESRVDILGYTQKQWEDFFKNLEAGKDKLGTWQTALQLVGQTFGEISNLMSAAENREFRAYEKTAKKKKKVLDDRLKKGLISQEAYNTAVEQIDDETDRKKEELERKQAIRSRALAVFQTLVNTSVAVTSALGMQPWGPWNIALAALVGTLGAIQTAAVLAAPLSGAEDGGYIDVVRSQDGKRFRAKRDPDRRGYIGGTSVIVSEDGTEFVASAAAVRNPTIRPVLDIIDVATRNGSVNTINLPAVIGATLPGRASGGYLGSAPTTAAFGYPDLSLGQLDGVLQRNAEVMQKMLDRLDRPIAAYTRKYGPGGLFDAIRRDKSIRKTL